MIELQPSHPLQRQRYTKTTNDDSLLSNSTKISEINGLQNDDDYDYDDYYDDYDDNRNKNQKNQAIERKQQLNKRISDLPGTIQTESDPQFDEVCDLDIDRVQLIAESDYDDDDDQWSVNTPPLPPLSMTSSDESINHDFGHSSQSDRPYSIKSRSNHSG